MNIPGITILSEQIIYTKTIIGTALCIFTLLGFLGCALIILNDLISPLMSGVLMAISFAICLFTIATTNITNMPTLLNNPYKVNYTVEITNDTAYKQLIMNYTILEKPYDNKEIYIVQGDYTK